MSIQAHVEPSSPSNPSSSSSSSSPNTNFSSLRHPSSNNSALVSSPKDREREKERERERRASARVSQHLQTGMPNTRLGSRSPNSIPSSPTSVHSSSSAIFERDIEPITCPSPPHPHGHNPHRRTPRSKVNEQLDQSVPSVLDSAAAILASTQGTPEDDRISVVAPARDLTFAVGGSFRSGVTSPIGSLRSRSPSPTSGVGASAGAGAGRRTSLLLSIPSPPLQTNVHLAATSGSPPGTARAPANLSIQTSSGASGAVGQQPNMSTPSIITPTSMYYSMGSSSAGVDGDGDGEGTSPTTTTLEHPPSSFPSSLSPQSYSQSISPSGLPLNLSHPPSPIISPLSLAPAGDKRLSFMSYTDLLASTPASLQPLSTFTTSASSAEPPPHIPSVSGITQASAQAQAHAQLHSHSPSHSPGRSLLCAGAAGVIEGRCAGDRDSIGVFDDAGGEWEREGLGSGLEERLEALLGLGPVGVGVVDGVGVLPVHVQGNA